jgi:hypothetical protein
MKAKRLLLVAAIMTLCGVVMHAAYPTHVSVTTQNGNKVTVTAVAENIIKVTNCAPGETTRLSRASVLNESTDGKCLNPDGKGTQVNVCGLSVMLESNGRVTIDGGAGKKVVAATLKADVNSHCR